MQSSYSYVIARRAKAKRPTRQSPGTMHRSAQQKRYCAGRFLRQGVALPRNEIFKKLQCGFTKKYIFEFCKLLHPRDMEFS